MLLPVALGACGGPPAPVAAAPAAQPVAAASPPPQAAPTATSEQLSTAADPKPAEPAASTASQSNLAPSASAPELPKGTLVLQIGDSFAAALGVELGKRLKAAGLRSALEYKTASYIPNWSFDGDVPHFIGKYNPDLVLITLGANELEIPNPEQRVGPVKHLVKL
ncbi:MAG TPA: hypothetical protein VGM29_11080, partial [Polyangiaceae bacterium]